MTFNNALSLERYGFTYKVYEMTFNEKNWSRNLTDQLKLKLRVLMEHALKLRYIYNIIIYNTCKQWRYECMKFDFWKSRKNLSRVNFTYKSTSIVHFLTSAIKIVRVYVAFVQTYQTRKTVFHFEIEISEYCSSLDFLWKILDNNIILGRKRPM